LALFHPVEVLLFEVLDFPPKLFEQQQTPAPLEVHHFGNLIQEGVQLVVYFLERENLVRLICEMNILAFTPTVHMGKRGRRLIGIFTTIDRFVVVVVVVLLLVLVIVLHLSNELI
jgi:hypothetical protein